MLNLNKSNKKLHIKYPINCQNNYRISLKIKTTKKLGATIKILATQLQYVAGGMSLNKKKT